MEGQQAPRRGEGALGVVMTTNSRHDLDCPARDRAKEAVAMIRSQ